MSDVLTKLINESEAKGEAKGETKGFIEALFEVGAADETIVSRIMKKFSLTEETAKEYVRKYRPSV